MFDPQQVFDDVLGSVAHFDRTECLESKHRVLALKYRLGVLDRLRPELESMMCYPRWCDLATQLRQAMADCDRWRIRLQSTQTSSGLGGYDYRHDAEKKRLAEDHFIDLALGLLRQLENVTSDC